MGLGDHNYCRNPDGEKTIWCYTTDVSKRWEYCDVAPAVSLGPEECSGTKCDGYRGGLTTTKSGKTCMKWTDQAPHKHVNTP